jgi:spectinomycin phosphotransferase
VRALPDEFDAGQLPALLADGWGFVVDTADYAPVGGGSYHWVVRDAAGGRTFVTVDDLDQKPWLGDGRDDVFDGLRRALDTAVALREGGLDFVVAPLPDTAGASVRRVDSRYTVALFPFVDGRPGRFGEYEPAERDAVVTMLAELHCATPAVGTIARRLDLDVPGRGHLEAALRELDEPWSGGPFSEPAREALARHASDVAELFALADRLRADVAAHGGDWVITHGEPHAGNVMRTGQGYVLVDWDTAALAPPERDLWMLGDDPGRKVDPVAMDFYRLAWDLDDLTAFTNELRLPHRESKDTVKAYEGLQHCLAARARWAARLA